MAADLTMRDAPKNRSIFFGGVGVGVGVGGGRLGIFVPACAGRQVTAHSASLTV